MPKPSSCFPHLPHKTFCLSEQQPLLPATSFCSHFSSNLAANPAESTSKVFSPSYHCLVQATTFSHLDYSISLQTGLVAFNLVPLVLILNTTANMICLKWKLHHATLLHWTHRKIQSPDNGLWASPSSGTQPQPHLSALRSYYSSCLLGSGHSRFKPLHLSPLLPEMFFLQLLRD